MVRNIILAKPRGFCAGVKRAIEVVEKAIHDHGTPVYVRHQIVHNDFVVNSLEKKGVIFVEDLDIIPNNNVVIFSAHGTPPKIKQKAKDRGLKVIDAVCPLVTKVHLEAQQYHKQGYSIILIGHRGHQEVIGTMGEAPMTLVETKEEVDNLEIRNSDKVIYLTQTTLSLDDTKEIIAALKQRFPKIKAPLKQDICYATTNRQDAVKELAKKTELILIIGAKNSSNSKRLVETAARAGICSYLIPDKGSIKEEWLSNINNLGITSGASVPEVLVKEVVEHIKNIFINAKIEEMEHVKESIRFRSPID